MRSAQTKSTVGPTCSSDHGNEERELGHNDNTLSQWKVRGYIRQCTDGGGRDIESITQVEREK